jgi:FMN phosphatase YigB (HAD superfamily)
MNTESMHEKRYIVFDMDGTLSDHSHRLHLVTGENKDYDKYFDLCGEDKPHWPVVNMLSILNMFGHRIEIWTGRPQHKVNQTMDWMAAHGIDLMHLKKMRPDGDYRPDFELKGQWLEEELIKPSITFEDRPSMVQFWRSKGIFCFDVGSVSQEMYNG